MESSENKKMTIEEAELYYKEYAGNTFYMHRDKPDFYMNFLSLDIDKETINVWNKEIIESLYKNLWNNARPISDVISCLFELIKCDSENIEKNFDRFLDVIEKCIYLDVKTRIIILEKFSGTTDSLKDGYCYTICTKTKLQEKMNRIITKLLDLPNIEDTELKEILEYDIKRYSKAYRKFKK